MMRKISSIGISLITVLAVLGACATPPSVPTLTMVVEADLSNVSVVEKERIMDSAIDIILRRIDKYGITEPIVQKQGERILVQLPGFTDIEAAKRLVEETGFLEFREVEVKEDGNPVYLSDYLENKRTEFFNEGVAGFRIFVDGNHNVIAFLDKDEECNLTYTDELHNPIDTEQLKQITEHIVGQPELDSAALVSWMPARGDDGTPLTGELLDKAEPGVIEESTGREYAVVDIEWSQEGGVIFDQIAQRLYNSGPEGSIQRALGIFLDNVLISYPQILEPEYHGSGAIVGNFTMEEVEYLANLLISGALPVPLTVVEVKVED